MILEKDFHSTIKMVWVGEICLLEILRYVESFIWKFFMESLQNKQFSFIRVHKEAKIQTWLLFYGFMLQDKETYFSTKVWFSILILNEIINQIRYR
jgi:hypothetical protein